eukprot:COSAG02_NODE_1292_length_13424_cov_31.074597_9_plen_86_part_00
MSSVSKQSRKGSGNVSYLYGLKRANGQPKVAHRVTVQRIEGGKDSATVLGLERHALFHLRRFVLCGEIGGVHGDGAFSVAVRVAG